VLISGAATVYGGEKKKLIEFGWDEPDAAFMRKHIAEMERTPFDGCVFHINYAKPNGAGGNFTWECWGTKAFTEKELEPALEDLNATRFDRFRDNFLRFNVTPGKIDWFNDFSAILQNAGLAARVAREGKCRGILFDIEEYEARTFQYRTRRDAATKSWKLYEGQARQRGREVMAAFQKEFPEIVVFLTFGYCLPWTQSENGKKPLAELEYGLLAPFLDGMMEASTHPRSIVDGCELAYSFKDTSKFAKYYQLMAEAVLPIVADPRKYRNAVSLGFGIWLDYDWRKLGWNTNDVAKNFYTPETFEASVREGLEVADEYVWVYTEQPRWWTSEGGSVQLPEPYVEALKRARMKKPDR
jgi:hypothetical protein